MSASEDYKKNREKYERIERSSDEFGRVIGVRRLKPSQRNKIDEWAPGLSGSTQITSPTGDVLEIPKNIQLMMAASVREIDQDTIPFPRNRGELDAILDRLDDEGIHAAITAMMKFNPPLESAGDPEAEGGVALAKN